MTTVVKLFGLLMILLCLWGMIRPRALIARVLDVWNRPWGIYMAVAVRIALGVVFVLAADQTRHPDIFTFLGYLMILAALAISFIGRRRLDRFMRWWQDKSPAVIRVWLLFGLLFGAFVVYAVG